MKFSLSIVALLVSASAVAAFAPNLPAASSTTTRTPSSSSSLNLFGSGGGGDAAAGGDKKAPGMMDQLAMFKKAQEMAQKKAKLDEELKTQDFSGEAADGKVKASFKYVPVTNPMDPNPDYEAMSFEIDSDYFESATAQELSQAVKACILDGIETTNQAVAEKYAVLQSDLMEAFGQNK
jgi:DNA-binding protein YbaB